MSSSSKAFKEFLISCLRARACSIFASHSRFALNSNGLKKERLLLSSRSSFPSWSNSSSSHCFCDFLTGLSNQYLAWSSVSFSARSRSFFFSGSYSSRFAMSFTSCSLRSCFASSLRKKPSLVICPLEYWLWYRRFVRTLIHRSSRVHNMPQHFKSSSSVAAPCFATLLSERSMAKRAAFTQLSYASMHKSKASSSLS